MATTPLSCPVEYRLSLLDGIDYTPVRDTTAGTVVALGGGLYGVARQLIYANTQGNLAIVGGFAMRLDGSSDFAVGDAVYWNANDNVATSNGSYSADKIGVAIEAVTQAVDTSVLVMLNSNSVPY